MTRETFLLLFVVGAATLALWVVLCLPRLAPRSMRAAAIHIVAALLVGGLLSPALQLIPGQPGRLSVLAALFGVAFPALVYMLLAGMWLLKVVADGPLASRR
jgi:hypothetical protein